MNARKLNEVMWELTEPGAPFTVRASFYTDGVAVYVPSGSINTHYINGGDLLDAMAVAQAWWHPTVVE